MNIKYCDKCKTELEPEEGNGIMIVKSYKIYFWKRNIFTTKKESYDEKEYCEWCFDKIIEKLKEV